MKFPFMNLPTSQENLLNNMKIHLSSTDIRALDGAVRSVAATIIGDGGVAVSFPVSSVVNKLPNGEVVSTVGRRIIGAFESSPGLVEKFAKMTLPSSVNILISFK
jgi:ribosomal protein S10